MLVITYMVQVHMLDNKYYIAVNGGEWREATAKEIREFLDL